MGGGGNLSLLLEVIRGAWCVVNDEADDENYRILFVGPDQASAEAFLKAWEDMNDAFRRYHLKKSQELSAGNVYQFPIDKWRVN